jgi:hypothetical protein
MGKEYERQDVKGKNETTKRKGVRGEVKKD